MRQLARLTCLAISGLAFSGCSTFRAAVRDWNNEDLVGRPAPALADGPWAGRRPELAGPDEDAD